MLVTGPHRADAGLFDSRGWTFTPLSKKPAGDHGYGSSVLLPDGPDGSSKVMVIGGAGQAGTEVLDAADLAAGWSPRATLPQPRRNANSVLTPDGAIITIGGNLEDNFGQPQKEALRYDPAADTWTPLAEQAEERGYHSTALLLPDGRIVSAGDDGPSGGGGRSDEIEIFSPPYLFKGARPRITSAPGAVPYGSSFTVGTPDTDVAKAVLVAPGATTHANDMHQRLVPLAVTPTAGGLQLTAPATTAIAPPGHYMLFLVDSAGVPSVARFVRLSTTAPAPGPGPGPGPGAGRPLPAGRPGRRRRSWSRRPRPYWLRSRRGHTGVRASRTRSGASRTGRGWARPTRAAGLSGSDRGPSSRDRRCSPAPTARPSASATAGSAWRRRPGVGRSPSPWRRGPARRGGAG